MIYAVLWRLNCCNSFSHYRAIVVEKRREKEISQKIDDLPILATCQSGTLVIMVLLPMEHLIILDMAHGGR